MHPKTIMTLQAKQYTVLILALLLLVSLTIIFPKYQQEKINLYKKTVLPTSTITINVGSTPQQTFGGFGTSHNNYDADLFGGLPQDRKDALAQLVWGDAKLRILRLWASPLNGDTQDLAVFTTNYIANGVISTALSHGATTLLLAPQAPTDSSIGTQSYAAATAQLIKDLKDQKGITINATGVSNEPDEASTMQIVNSVKLLRTELNNRSLQSVQIVAPDASSMDDTALAQFDALRADPSAWAALAAFSTHTYNMGANLDIQNRLRNSGKQYWITESGQNGPQSAGNLIYGIMSAARVLSDLNHGATHWIWFIDNEPLPNSAEDNATDLINYYPAKPFHPFLILHQYYSLKQLATAFDVGAIMRTSTSSLEGDMGWTHGKKLRLYAAAGKNPDGSYAIGIANYTGDSPIKPVSPDMELDIHAAQSFDVTLNLSELTNIDNTIFEIYRTNSNKNISYEGTIIASNGIIAVHIKPMELITLHSRVNHGSVQDTCKNRSQGG